MSRGFGKFAFGTLNDSQSCLKQFNLYIDLTSTPLTLKEYFKRQFEVDLLQKKGAKEISWEFLKKTNIKYFEHEVEHFNVYENYCISSKLYLEGKGTPFVMDVDFASVAKLKKYKKTKVIEILKEMLIAPYKKSLIMGSEYVMDIVFYETLQEGIKSNKESVFIKVFQKYIN